METRFTSDPAVLTRLNAAAVLGMSAAKSRAEAEREELIAATVAASLEDVSRYSRDGGFVFPTSANVAIGRA